jgi:hypothetical protein
VFEKRSVLITSDDAVHVESESLSESTTCAVGGAPAPQQDKTISGIYDGVQWNCSAEVADAELLDEIDRALAR